MKHKHVVGKIEYRGKEDSIYITCITCEHIECVGVWFENPPKNWSEVEWEEMKFAISSYLYYVNKNMREGKIENE